MSDVLDVMPTKIIDNDAVLLYYLAASHIDATKGRVVQQKVLAYLSGLTYSFGEEDIKHNVCVGEWDTLHDYNVMLQDLLERHCASEGECGITVTHPYLDVPLKYVLACNSEGNARISKGILKGMAVRSTKHVIPRETVSKPGPTHVSKLLGAKEYVDWRDLLYVNGTSEKLVGSNRHVYWTFPVTKVVVKASASTRNKLETVATYDVKDLELGDLNDVYIKAAASAFLDCNLTAMDPLYVIFEIEIGDDVRSFPVLECHRSFHINKKRWLRSVCFM